MLTTTVRILAASAACLLAAAASPASSREAADLIIYDAHIVTVDRKFSIARAVGIRDGKFIAVGTEAEVMRHRGPRTRMIDLDGRTVLPGFNDTHVHLTAGKALEIQVDLTAVRSIRDIQAEIAKRAKSTKAGQWIVGTRGWWEYQLKEGRLPTRADLDLAAPDHPVAIPGPHYLIVNSRALARAGIDRDTPEPRGGEIWKDKNGEPTGLLMDNAGQPVRRLLPEPAEAQKLNGFRRVLKLLNSNGITSAGEPSGNAEDSRLLRELRSRGELSVRVDFAYNIDPAAPLDEVEKQLKALPAPGADGDGLFRSDQLGETGLDGAELTALLSHDYPTKPGYRGLQKVSTEQFSRFAALVARHGWRLRPHAVGDAAIDEALDAFEFADGQVGIRGRRWMIDHAFLLLPRHYQRVKRLGLIINSQYMHNYQLGALILKAWMRPLADRSERYRDWIANGIMFAGGSDGPISYHAEPLLEIYGEVTRRTGWGGSLGPDQGISRADAIRSVTINGAYTSFEEKVKGSLEPGKYADFVVLSDDILAVPAERIKDIDVLATVLGGRTVHGSLDGSTGRTAEH